MASGDSGMGRGQEQLPAEARGPPQTAHPATGTPEGRPNTLVAESPRDILGSHTSVGLCLLEDRRQGHRDLTAPPTPMRHKCKGPAVLKILSSVSPHLPQPPLRGGCRGSWLNNRLQPLKPRATTQPGVGGGGWSGREGGQEGGRNALSR